ncbi:MAG: peptidoglycan DD-metalloendopeptidase family protein [Cyanophyceae cyanobacterium]
MKDEMMPLVKAISLHSAKSAPLDPHTPRKVTDVNQGETRSSTPLFKLLLSVGALSSVLIPHQERAIAVDSISVPTLLIPAPHQGDNLAQSLPERLTEPETQQAPGHPPSSVAGSETLWEISQRYQPLPTIAAERSQPEAISAARTLTSIPTSSEPAKVLKLQPEERSAELALSEASLEVQQRQEQALANLRQQKQQLSLSLTQLWKPESQDSAPQQASSKPQLIAHSALAAARSASSPTEDATGATVVPPPQIFQPTLSVEPVYRVKPGDTLQEIAHRHQVTYPQLAAANRLENPDLIQVNQQLQIPSSRGAVGGSYRMADTSDAGETLLDERPGCCFEQARSLESPRHERASTATVTTSNVNSLAQPTNQPLEADSYAEKLRADVAKLQQEYRAQSPQPPRTSPPRSAQNLNAEKKYSRRSLGHLRGQQARRSPATAPVEIEYYSRLQPLAGEMVEPELPPLSSPEPYLPDSERGTQFTGYIWPAAGVLTSGYGRRWGRMHKGIDVAGPIGTPIVAVAAGQVVSAGWNSGGFGNLVKVKHDNGSLSLYAHNSRILVRQGQYVEQGQLIAEMGNSGYSTGPHLHFEIHPEGKGAVNPMAFLPKPE